jgi:hypothetical protein
MLAKISLLDADNPLGGSTESSFLLLNEKQKKHFTFLKKSSLIQTHKLSIPEQ